MQDMGKDVVVAVVVLAALVGMVLEPHELAVCIVEQGALAVYMAVVLEQEIN